MTNTSVHTYLLILRDELAPFRGGGATLSPHSVEKVCRLLSVCAAEVEQMAIMLRKEAPVLIDPTDDKVVCIARYRRPHPGQPHGGGDAA